MESYELGSDKINGVLNGLYNKKRTDEYIAKLNNQPFDDLRLFYSNNLGSWSTTLSNVNDINANINIDIKFRKYFYISSYSMKSSANPKNNEYHPVAWNVYGAIDNHKWVLIDKIDISNDGFGNLETRNFPCKARIFDKIRIEFFRLDTSSSNFNVAMRQIDFFGYLISHNVLLPFRCSFMHRKVTLSCTIFVSFFLSA